MARRRRGRVRRARSEGVRTSAAGRAGPRPRAPGSNPHTVRWAQWAGSYDGYIFVTPEYNGGAPASLQNAIDHLYQEWTRKAVVYVGYGVFGAVTAVQELRAQAGRLQLAGIGPQVVLSLPEDFAANTEFKPQPRIQEVRKLVEELLTWNTALAPLRADPRAVA